SGRQCALSWHLLVCSCRISEVTTATLGPLPLVQPPKSKPFTPYGVVRRVQQFRRTRPYTYNRRQPTGIPGPAAGLGPVRGQTWGWPLQALAVAETRPQGPDRQGRSRPVA